MNNLKDKEDKYIVAESSPRVGFAFAPDKSMFYRIRKIVELIIKGEIWL